VRVSVVLLVVSCCVLVVLVGVYLSIDKIALAGSQFFEDAVLGTLLDFWINLLFTVPAVLVLAVFGILVAYFWYKAAANPLDHYVLFVVSGFLYEFVSGLLWWGPLSLFDTVWRFHLFVVYGVRLMHPLDYYFALPYTLFIQNLFGVFFSFPTIFVVISGGGLLLYVQRVTVYPDERPEDIPTGIMTSHTVVAKHLGARPGITRPEDQQRD
jgi:hypothetical protein